MPKMTLTIEVDEAGQVSVSGPIDNLMLCYSVLEIAKDVLRERSAEVKRRVERPAARDLALFGGGRG